MPAKSPFLTHDVLAHLIKLGAEIRAHRKALGINATTVAESAGISRVTLHRIEKGHPTVTMGAYLNVLASLNMPLPACSSATAQPTGWLPVRIKINDYPQLRQLAWQIHGVDTLSLREALDIYQRNWRHIDQTALNPEERELINNLHETLEEGSGNV